MRNRYGIYIPTDLTDSINILGRKVLKDMGEL
jgi:hypothetical protein